MDAVLDPPVIPTKPATYRGSARNAPLFTKENTAEYARKATIARVNNAKLRKAALDPASYIEFRLSRVRAQLQKIDGLIDTETDPQKLDRLVCAQNRLSEQWRIFSGIPLPGSRRPGRESTPKQSGEVGPVE